jgi:hypothetical protein
MVEFDCMIKFVGGGTYALLAVFVVDAVVVKPPMEIAPPSLQCDNF